MEKAILFVDDELSVLTAMKRSPLRREYELFVAQSAKEALHILEERTIDVVISDMRMPDMSGHALLRKVKELYPLTIRLILSGDADENEMAGTMLDGSSKMYILKPWDTELLISTIRRLVDVREMLCGHNLFRIISELERICTLPDIYLKISELINQEADLGQIVKVIEADPGIALQVLHVANSAFSGVKTGSVSRAVMYLGLTAVKSLILSMYLCQLPQGSQPRAGKKELLWRHAIRTNELTGRLYRGVIGKPLPAISCAAGLLHNIGEVVLQERFGSQYAEIEKAQKLRPEAMQYELEHEWIGASHQEVGGYLLDWWNLPHPLVESAMFHHSPFHENVNDKQLLSVVHIASCFAAKEIYISRQEPLDERALELFNLTQEECRRLLE